MQEELYALFRRNCPFVVREAFVAKSILGHEGNQVITRRNRDGQLIAATVIHGNAILMLCVDEPYRRQGLGSELLRLSEEIIQLAGHDEVIVGAGFDYLAPGVPTSRRYVPAVNEALDPRLDDSASAFFEKRGYDHSWGGNCFDMRFPLSEFRQKDRRIGDTLNGVTYRWATPDDLEAVCACTDDACAEFTPYYRDAWLYAEYSRERALIATIGSKVVGTLIVSLETDGEGLSSIGCTTVRTDHRGEHIAVNLVTLGTAYLKERGMVDAYLSYTYSGLDYLYGQAGYKICIYYMMAKKTF